MSVTLVLQDHFEHRLTQLAGLKVETAAVLLARPVLSPSGDLRLLVRQFHEVPDGAYNVRDALRMEITSDGYVPALGQAEKQQSVPLWLHTHPGEGSIPLPSVHDQKVDRQLSDLFRLRANSAYYGAVIVSMKDNQLTFSGHIDDGVVSHPIDRLLVVGDRLSLRTSFDSTSDPIPELFSRNVRAFGGEVQRVLRELRISVVGTGGTGSAVAEQLVRLGVRNIHLVDPDVLSTSNISRVYGSTKKDVGRPKVSIIGDHLQSIAPDLWLKTTARAITTEAVARSLTDSDIIFGCTDDNAGRLVLSRLASYMLIPVFDCGVILTSNVTGKIEGIHGRVTILRPGAACLVCRKRVDLARANSELLAPVERRRLVDDGYVPSLEQVEPAVVTFTSAVASAAVNELLENLTGFGPDPVPSEIILRLHDREISTNLQKPTPHHYCDPAGPKLGAGVTEPFLGMTWAV